MRKIINTSQQSLLLTRRPPLYIHFSSFTNIDMLCGFHKYTYDSLVLRVEGMACCIRGRDNSFVCFSGKLRSCSAVFHSRHASPSARRVVIVRPRKSLADTSSNDNPESGRTGLLSPVKVNLEAVSLFFLVCFARRIKLRNAFRTEFNPNIPLPVVTKYSPKRLFQPKF